MTAIKKETMDILERIPEDKVIFILQIMQGVNGSSAREGIIF